MAKENTLAANVQERAKALEDWAISVIGNTAKLSAEAEQALRHHGTKGLRGRPFSYTVGNDAHALVLHAEIAGILLSTYGLMDTMMLVPANMQYQDGSRMTDANLVFVENNGVAGICWMLMRDVFVLKEATAAHAVVAAILEIE